MAPRFSFALLLSLCALGASTCGSPSAPTPPAATVTSVSITGLGGSPIAGDTVQLTALAAFSDNTTQTVTTQVTWETSNQAIATVSSAGIATFVAPGDADLKATFRSVTATTHVTVGAKAPPRFTVRGTVVDAGTNRPLQRVQAVVVDGADAGRSVETDSNGSYAVENLTAGTFTLRMSRSDYETKSVQVVLSSNTVVDVALRALPNVTAFYGTFGVTLSVAQQSCEFPFTVGPSGTFRITGAPDGTSITVTIVERGTTRTYGGSMTGDGRFSGRGGGVIAGITTGRNTHDYTGSVSGTASAQTLSATEDVVFGVTCPGKTMKIGYAGNK